MPSVGHQLEVVNGVPLRNRPTSLTMVAARGHEPIEAIQILVGRGGPTSAITLASAKEDDGRRA